MNPINIVCATDDKYVPYCGVMLVSLFENNKDREVNVYIMVDKALSKTSLEYLSSIKKQYGQSINYCMVDKSFLEKYPIKGKDRQHLSIVTYYRLYAADLLPVEVDKVLYLDCDIIVNGFIGTLFDMDWDNYAIGIVPDMCVEWSEYYERLQYDKGLGYFNAGVMMMNLQYWRTSNMAQQCFDYLASNYERIENNDQDVMNVVMKDCKYKLSVKYNFQIQMLMPYFFNTFSKDLQDEVLGETPIIIHYAAELKPWMAYYYSYPFYDIWQKYKKLSPWKYMRDKLPANRKFVAFVKRYFIWPLGLWLKKPQLVEGWKQ
jgi:lipopolysaccharide biosynthesis glycosyltransferase